MRLKCSLRRLLRASGSTSAFAGLCVGASYVSVAGSPPDAAAEYRLVSSGDARFGEMPACVGGGWKFGSGGGLLAASGWNSRVCSGLPVDQAASVRCAGTRTEVREDASALFLFFAACHIAIPASSWAA